MTLLIFVLGPSGSPALAAVASVSGTIEKIEQVDRDQFELSIRVQEGVSTFSVSRATPVEESVPIKQVKPGQKILLSKTPAQKGTRGMKGMKDPFGNMSSGTKKFLGLPQISEIPEIPKIPKVPKVPEIPGMMKKSRKPAPEGAPQEAAPQMGMNPNDMQLAEQKQPEPEVPDLPKDAGTSGLTPNPLSTPSDAEPEALVKRVIGSKKTSKGIEIQLEGEQGQNEAMILSPDDVVVRILSVDDLRKRMNVHLEVAEDANGKLVHRIVIA